MLFKYLSGIALGLSLAIPAQAQDRPVALSSSVLLVAPADAATGQPEKLVDAASVVPQDQLVFTVSYRNTSNQPVTDLLIVNPVPSTVRVAEQSAASTEVSVDGGTRWGRLAQLTIAKADGTRVPATVDDISHMRWVVARIEPGEAGTVSFRAAVR